MKIEVGKYYKTRGGNRAYIGAINKEATKFEQCIGWIEDSNYQWYIDGRFDVRETSCDLIAEWQDESPELKEIELLIEQEVVSQRIDKLNKLITVVNQLIRERKV